jgi:hypothetical protein
VAAVGADDHPGVLGDRLAAEAVTTDAGDAPVLDDDLLDGEPFPNLRAAWDAASTSSMSSTVRRGP